MAELIPIYRFLDCHAALKTLEVGKFRVGLISRLNDPFEWRVGFSGITTPEEQAVADKLNGEHQPWLESWMGVTRSSARHPNGIPSFSPGLPGTSYPG